MTTAYIIIGWLMVVAGFVTFAIAKFHYGNLFESDVHNQLFDAFRLYILGLALLIAILGGILLRANGVDFDWPETE